MHRIFQNFIDLLSNADVSADFSEAMAVTAESLNLSCFAYLALPPKSNGQPRLISTYPEEWTSHYFRLHYQRIDPVIGQVLQDAEPCFLRLANAGSHRSLTTSAK
jgi:LuxR family transcriptional regulator, activator of conjugal transfer of Ti plasmids